ncbi:MAG: hypothetical protein FD181_1568 [Prolixibacteraceae bacterium]|nr:MAG: hypothetical protein FD181_1568 [Prolixibacteraceae bacterium]
MGGFLINWIVELKWERMFFHEKSRFFAKSAFNILKSSVNRTLIYCQQFQLSCVVLQKPAT